jgi:hypothetical protein
MGFPLFKRLDGVTDGLNRVFYTEVPYIIGTVRVFRNGILIEGSLDDGWIEQGGNKILMKEPPSDGDRMQVFYESI